MNKLSFPTLLIATFLMGLHAQAQTLTLSQAINKAIQYNPAMKLSADKIKEAQSQIEQIKEQQLPHAKASASFSQFNLINPFVLTLPGGRGAFGIPSGPLDATMAAANADEEIFAGGQIRNSLKASEYLLQAATLDTAQARLNLSYGITAAFYAIYKTMKSQQIMALDSKDLSEKIREVTNREKAGVATKNDVLRIRLQRSNLEMGEKNIESAQEIAYYTLKLMTGVAEGQDIIIDTTSLFSTPTLPSYQNANYAFFENAALQNRPEIKANAFRQQAAEMNLQVIKADKYPHLGVGAGYNFINPSNKLKIEKNGYINAWNIGIHLSYNISSLYMDKGKTDKALVAIEELKNASDRQDINIKKEAFTNYSAWKLSKAKINLSDSIIAQATENYREMQARYRNSVATLSDMLNANTLLLKAQLDKINAIADAQLAYYKLLYSAAIYPQYK